MRIYPTFKYLRMAARTGQRGLRNTVLILSLTVVLSSTSATVASATQIRSVAILNAPELNDSGNEQAQLWQAYMRSFDLSTRLISRQDLSRGLDGYQMLVIPDVRTFSEAERDQILDFVSQGKALLITGRSGNTTTAGKRSLADALGLQYKDVGKISDDSWSIVMDAPSRLTAGLPRMQRMTAQINNPPTLAQSQTPIAFWLSSALAKPDYEKAGQNAAVIANNYGPGKVVWLGFNIDTIGGDLDSSEVFFRLMENILYSFRNLPVHELAPWPFPYRKGILYSMDVEERFGNMAFVHEIPNLRAITYFILTYSAGLHQELLREVAEASKQKGSGKEIAAGGEIGVHGDNHDVFKGQPRDTQRQRLQRTSDYIYEITGKRPIGFRPPEEAYDYFTLEALVETGFEYLLGNNAPDRAEPKITRVGDKRLVHITILNKDDINLITQAGRPEPPVVLENYLYDIDAIFKRGGLYVINLHSQILAVQEYLPVLKDIVTYTNSKEAWTVNGVAVYDWWLRRDGIHISVDERSSQRMRFTVTNRGTTTVENIAVNVWIPETARATMVESPAGGRRVLDFLTDRSQLKLRVPVMKPDDSIEYLIQWRD